MQDRIYELQDQLRDSNNQKDLAYNEQERQKEMTKRAVEERDRVWREVRTIRDRIKDVWQTQCESFIFDPQVISAVKDSPGQA